MPLASVLDALARAGDLTEAQASIAWTLVIADEMDDDLAIQTAVRI